MGLVSRVMSETNDFLFRLQRSQEPLLDIYPLVANTWMVLGIILGYLLMVKLGPIWMKDRKPFNLYWTIIFYNLFLTIFSAGIVYELGAAAYSLSYNLICQPAETAMTPLTRRMFRACWLYYFSKIVEILDTVLIILRKKNRQLSFLHIYHHSSIIVMTWAAVRFYPGGDKCFCGILNSLVHVFMYFYYALSAIGPEVQKYLWWKKYITKLQLSQFLFLNVKSIYNIVTMPCVFPTIVHIGIAVYTLIFLYLFGKFYLKSYKSAPEKKSHTE